VERNSKENHLAEVEGKEVNKGIAVIILLGM
jgi:hypothetical protein